MTASPTQTGTRIRMVHSFEQLSGCVHQALQACHCTTRLARTVNLANPQTQAQTQDALKRRQQESSQRFLDAAFPFLSAQQTLMVLLPDYFQVDCAAQDLTCPLQCRPAT
jgi:hypothetical protein